VIVRAGETAGLSWEIGECAKAVDPHRLIILVPLSRRGYENLRAAATPIFPRRLPEYTGRRVGEITLRAIVYFDADWGSASGSHHQRDLSVVLAGDPR
jgi:hypothetical protein